MTQLHERWDVTELKVICKMAGEWGEANWRSEWSRSYSVELVMKGQNMGVKVIDCVRSKSGRLRFTHFQTLLYACSSLVCEDVVLTESFLVYVLSGVQLLVL